MGAGLCFDKQHKKTCFLSIKFEQKHHSIQKHYKHLTAFFNSLEANYFHNHALCYKTCAYSRWDTRMAESINKLQRESWRTPLKEEMMQCYHWPSKLFLSKERFAAVHVQIEIRDCYHFESYEGKSPQIVVSPFPSFFWLFREKFLEMTPRLWLEFIPFSVAETNITTKKYTDNCMINECIRWLELPLEHATRQQRRYHNGVEPEIIGDDFNWQEPLLTGSERILHIGSENASLNMKKMMRFVAALANVCCFFPFFNI